MLLIVWCGLSVCIVRCWLFVACCSLCVARCVLFVACCLSRYDRCDLCAVWRAQCVPVMFCLRFGVVPCALYDVRCSLFVVCVVCIFVARW